MSAHSGSSKDESGVVALSLERFFPVKKIPSVYIYFTHMSQQPKITM